MFKPNPTKQHLPPKTKETPTQKPSSPETVGPGKEHKPSEVEGELLGQQSRNR